MPSKIIAVHDADGWKYPNLALMKISAWNKAQGYAVERYQALYSENYCETYSSKVFSFTSAEQPLGNVTYGGTGYEGKFKQELPEHIEHICPDYGLYGINYSLGFLTRGCIRSCPWCVVPAKEGKIRAHADIEEFCRHENVVLMDNNVLAHGHGVSQIEKISRLGLRVDFNQGLDARLIDSQMAKRLAKIRWFKPLRLACDDKSQIYVVEKAVKILRAHSVNPKAYFCYVLVKDIGDAEERVMFLQGLGVSPFAQPYRSFDGVEPTQIQKDFARWCNRPWLRKTVKFKDYKPRKTA